MATLEEIRTRIKRIIHDVSYTDEIIDSFINEGISRCATLVLLPALESIGQITTVTDSAYTSIPTSWNFDRNITLCVNEDNVKVKVLSSLIMMSRVYPTFGINNEEGPVEACTTISDKFFYYPIPETSEVLTCTFYQKPSSLVNDSDTPSCLPNFLHYKLLVSFACAEIFNEIEEGNDGVLTNTKKHTAAFMLAIEELRDTLRTGQSRPEPNRSKDWI